MAFFRRSVLSTLTYILLDETWKLEWLSLTVDSHWRCRTARYNTTSPAGESLQVDTLAASQILEVQRHVWMGKPLEHKECCYLLDHKKLKTHPHVHISFFVAHQTIVRRHLHWANGPETEHPLLLRIKKGGTSPGILTCKSCRHNWSRKDPKKQPILSYSSFSWSL